MPLIRGLDAATGDGAARLMRVTDKTLGREMVLGGRSCRDSRYLKPKLPHRPAGDKGHPFHSPKPMPVPG